MRTIISVAGLAFVLLLSGCVVSLGDRGGSKGEAEWQRAERENREQIERLRLGMSLDQVRSRIGPPDFSEAFEHEGSEYRVLMYRTHRTRADGITTRDETTPLIFTNGVLSSWGETAYFDLTGMPLGDYN